MKLLFLDTETGGLDENKYSLLTIGMVVWEKGEILLEKEIFVKKDSYFVDPEGMRVNGINLDELRSNGIAPSEVINEINEVCDLYFGQEKVILAGHNIKFDISFLKKFYIDNGKNFERRFSHKSIDTVSVMNYLTIKDALPNELNSFDKLLKHYNIEICNRHTALSDAKLTALLFNKLLEIEL